MSNSHLKVIIFNESLAEPLTKSHMTSYLAKMEIAVRTKFFCCIFEVKIQNIEPFNI